MTNTTTNDDWDSIGYLLGSTHRLKIFQALAAKPRTPTQLADETGIAVTHISRNVSDLRDHDLVDLLVSEDTHKGRIYGLSDRGQTLIDDNPRGVFDTDPNNDGGPRD